MKVHINEKRVLGKRDKMIYGHFIEHFHRQIYGGVYEPGSPMADEDGFRQDVLEAMRKIKVPVLRWPGGCFVSSYHWKEAVGKERSPMFDKSWRVEDPNTFGTDEYIKLCRKIGCEPYICTNAGTGTPEEMSDWAEYCNLETEGKYARWRIENGSTDPYKVKYWSIGNENYGSWEIGAKSASGWGELVRESAKMMIRVDPGTELTAAALTDLEWNINLLKNGKDYLKWISIHEYWDGINQTNDYADYGQCMAYTKDIGHSIDEIRGLLTAMKLEKKIKIAFDEWNLRGWYHPNVHTIRQGLTKEEYLYPRDENDDNSKYTMADAVFTACFLNTLNRNCDIVGMANYAPIINTRGCIYTCPDGMVLRSTYFVFYLYVNYLGDIVLDTWSEDAAAMEVKNKHGERVSVDSVDILATGFSEGKGLALAAINKEADEVRRITLSIPYDEKDVTMSYLGSKVSMYSLSGSSTESYNDVGHMEVKIEERDLGHFYADMVIDLKPHSVNIIRIGNERSK